MQKLLLSALFITASMLQAGGNQSMIAGTIVVSSAYAAYHIREDRIVQNMLDVEYMENKNDEVCKKGFLAIRAVQKGKMHSERTRWYANHCLSMLIIDKPNLDYTTLDSSFDFRNYVKTTIAGLGAGSGLSMEDKKQLWADAGTDPKTIDTLADEHLNSKFADMLGENYELHRANYILAQDYFTGKNGDQDIDEAKKLLKDIISANNTLWEKDAQKLLAQIDHDEFFN
jgi:hypothetical protein